MPSAKNKRAEYQRVYRAKLKLSGKPTKTYFKDSPRNTNKGKKINENGTNYELLAMSHKNQQGNLICSDLFVDFYLTGLNFQDIFNIKSVYIVPERQINFFFKNLKREIEAVYPNVLCVFNYSLTFNSKYSKGKNGIDIQLCNHIPSVPFSVDVLKDNEERLMAMARDIKSHVLKSFDKKSE